jgi:ribonuclease PH
VDAVGQARFIEVQGTAEEAPYTRAQLDAMLQLAEQGIVELRRLQQAALAGGEGNA